MPGNPHRNGFQSGASQITDRSAIRDRQHECQRAWPESGSQSLSPIIEPCDASRHRKITDVGDERIESGPPLGLVDPGYRQRIRRIGRQAIDRFGRHQHQTASPECGYGGGELRCASSAIRNVTFAGI